MKGQNNQFLCQINALQVCNMYTCTIYFKDCVIQNRNLKIDELIMSLFIFCMYFVLKSLCFNIGNVLLPIKDHIFMTLINTILIVYE